MSTINVVVLVYYKCIKTDNVNDWIYGLCGNMIEQMINGARKINLVSKGKERERERGRLREREREGRRERKLTQNRKEQQFHRMMDCSEDQPSIHKQHTKN